VKICKFVKWGIPVCCCDEKNVNVSSQLRNPKGTNIMCRFAKCFEVTKGFSCFKMLGTMTLHVSSQAHLFPEPEHTFKRASDMMPSNPHRQCTGG
jgi:hypothetical protein